MNLLDDINRRLQRVKTKERSVLFSTGLSRVILVGFSGLIVYFLVDWFFELPYWARLVAFLGLLGGVGVNVLRHIIEPLREEMDDDDVALRVESRHKELQGRLISTVQLARSQSTGEYCGSEELLQALESETLKMASPMDFLRVISKEKLVKVFVGAFLILAINGFAVFKFPEYFQALALRLVKPSQQYPTDTRIKEIIVPEFVARGDKIVVKVILHDKYVIPSESGSLVFTSVKEGAEIPVELEHVGGAGAVFKGVLARALEDVTVEAFVGDTHRGNEATIRVLARPEVATGTVRYTYPKYTGRKTSDAKEFGGLSALQNSTAMMTFTSTKPLVVAQIERGDGGTLDLVKADKEGLKWKLKEPFLVDKSSNYMVYLKDTNGLVNSTPRIVYPVEAISDRQPKIKLRRPSRDTTIIPTAKKRIVFDVKDDYGARIVWLVYRIRKAGKPQVSAETFRKGTLVKGRDRRNLQGESFEFNLTPLNLKSGDELVFWLETDDECEANDVLAEIEEDDEGNPKPGAKEVKEYPRTADVKFSIVSKEEKLEELQIMLVRLVEIIENTTENVGDSKKAVVKLLLMIKDLKKE